MFLLIRSWICKLSFCMKFNHLHLTARFYFRLCWPSHKTYFTQKKLENKKIVPIKTKCQYLPKWKESWAEIITGSKKRFSLRIFREFFAWQMYRMECILISLKRLWWNIYRGSGSVAVWPTNRITAWFNCHFDISWTWAHACLTARIWYRSEFVMAAGKVEMALLCDFLAVFCYLVVSLERLNSRPPFFTVEFWWRSTHFILVAQYKRSKICTPT